MKPVAQSVAHTVVYTTKEARAAQTPGWVQSELVLMKRPTVNCASEPEYRPKAAERIRLTTPPISMFVVGGQTLTHHPVAFDGTLARRETCHET